MFLKYAQSSIIVRVCFRFLTDPAQLHTTQKVFYGLKSFRKKHQNKYNLVQIKFVNIFTINCRDDKVSSRISRFIHPTIITRVVQQDNRARRCECVCVCVCIS